VIKKLLRLFKKKRKPSLVWLYINNTQYYGVIGWLVNNKRQAVRGEDNWQRK
jgi:hypothetical protein